MSLVKSANNTNLRLNASADAAFSPASGSACCFFQPTNVGGTRTMIQTDDGSDGFILRIGSSTSMNMVVRDSTNTAITCVNNTFGTLVTTGTWYFLWGWWDSTSIGCGILGDGITTTEGTQAMSNGPSTSLAGAFTVAGRTGGQAANNFEGKISDIRFYNRKLTAAEFHSIAYSRGADEIANGLLLRLPLFDRAPGTTVSGNEPKDSANPSRSWTVTGTGGTLTYGDSAVRRRKRTR